MVEKEPVILTAQEVAEYLRLGVTTVYKLAQDGEIPAMKVGREWRFRQDLINEWLRQESVRAMKSEDNTEEFCSQHD